MKSSSKRIVYRDLIFEIPNDVYEPAEDSFLAVDNLGVKEDDDVLDMGTGCGILAITAAKTARRIVATDINPHAVNCTRKNAETNILAHKIDVRTGHLFQPVRPDEEFSLIIFNAPYLPSEPGEEKSWIDRSWVGGPGGRQVIDRFIREAPKHLRNNGRILLVQSTLSDVDETMARFCEEHLQPQVVAERKVAFETIVLIQASHLSHKPRKRNRVKKIEISGSAMDQIRGFHRTLGKTDPGTVQVPEQIGVTGKDRAISPSNRTTGTHAHLQRRLR